MAALRADQRWLDTAAAARGLACHGDRVQPGALGVRRSSRRSTPGSARTGMGHARGAHRAPAHGHLRARPQPVVRRARRRTRWSTSRASSPTTARGWCRCRSPRRSATAAPWGGLSARTALRTGPGPPRWCSSARTVPQVAADPSLTQRARLPPEVGRIEFKAFDSCPDPRSTASCSACSPGWCWTRPCRSARTTPDAALHRHAARVGLGRPRAAARAPSRLLDAAAAARSPTARPTSARARIAARPLRPRRVPARAMLARYDAGDTVAGLRRPYPRVGTFGTASRHVRTASRRSHASAIAACRRRIGAADPRAGPRPGPADPVGSGVRVLRVRVAPRRAPRRRTGGPRRSRIPPTSAYCLTNRGLRPRFMPGHVRPDQHLRVAVRAGADADRRDDQLGGDPLGDVGRHHLQHDRERPRRLQRQRVLDQPLAGVAAALDRGTRRARARSAG